MAAVLPHAAFPAGADRRSGTPLYALAFGGLVGVLQTVCAQRFGLLRWDTAPAQWWAVELATLAWLSATSVVLGVLVARLVVGSRWHRAARRDGLGWWAPEPPRPRAPRAARLFVPGAAALGSLLTVPFVTSSAAWAALFGGGIPTWRIAVYIFVGVLFGVATATFVQRSAPLACGTAMSILVIWALALLSAGLNPHHPPALGHPDLGLGSAGWLPRTASLITAVGYGLGVGVLWRHERRRARALAAGTGPALLAVTYLAVLPVAGSWPWSPLPTALLAVAAAATGGILGRRLPWLFRQLARFRAGRRTATTPPVPADDPAGCPAAER